MSQFAFHHIHLYSRDPMATAKYYQRIFDAKIIESVQTDGQPRIDLDINGLGIFIMKVPADKPDMPETPAVPHLGLDHFGFRVSKLDEVAAELKRPGSGVYDRTPYDPARNQGCLHPGSRKRSR